MAGEISGTRPPMPEQASEVARPNGSISVYVVNAIEVAVAPLADHEPEVDSVDGCVSVEIGRAEVCFSSCGSAEKDSAPLRHMEDIRTGSVIEDRRHLRGADVDTKLGDSSIDRGIGQNPRKDREERRIEVGT